MDIKQSQSNRIAFGVSPMYTQYTFAYSNISSIIHDTIIYTEVEATENLEERL